MGRTWEEYYGEKSCSAWNCPFEPTESIVINSTFNDLGMPCHGRPHCYPTTLISLVEQICMPNLPPQDIGRSSSAARMPEMEKLGVELAAYFDAKSFLPNRDKPYMKSSP